MTYVSMAKRLRLCRQMKLILLRNQERMKKAAASTATKQPFGKRLHQL